MNGNTHTERPILFSGDMVRAIIEGRKTQTRRVVTSRTSLFDGHPWPHYLYEGDHLRWEAAWVDSGPSPAGNLGPYLKLPNAYADTVHRIYPRTLRGTLLYVRETWAVNDIMQGDLPISEVLFDEVAIAYRADGSWVDQFGPEAVESWCPPWRPGIHMPKRIARVWLQVESVRVERVQEISEADALAEGIVEWVPEGEDAVVCGPAPAYRAPGFDDFTYGHSAAGAFRRLWDSINAKRGFGWDANPWVWVVEFSVASTTGRDAVLEVAA